MIVTADDEDDDEQLAFLQTNDDSEAEYESDSEVDPASLPADLIIYITTDNATNISKAVEDSGFSHIRFFAHTVNLAVQTVLEVTSGKRKLVKICKIVKYFRKSYKAKYDLRVCKVVVISCQTTVKANSAS